MPALSIRIVPLVATAGIGALAIAYFSPYRLVAEKIATALVMPYGLCWLLSLALCLVTYGTNRKTFLTAFALCISLFVGGNSWLANRLTYQLEHEFFELQPLGDERSFETVIVLGGGTSVRPGHIPQLGSSGDRLFLAAELFHAKKTKSILCTGRRIEALDRSGQDPCQTATQLLLRVGVPGDRITTIGGRTTDEEMRELAERKIDGQIGLITSAWHMGRALRIAQSQGLRVQPLPADFLTPPDRRLRILDLIPNAYSAEVIRLAMKERLADFVGR